jgi:hypothetical protein
MENVPGRGFAVLANGRGMTQTEIERLALDDGFDGAESMAEWFADTHGLPFDGFLIRWANAPADRPAVSGKVRRDVGLRHDSSACPKMLISVYPNPTPS